MGSAELKSNLHALIDHADEAMLRAICALLSSADNSNNVGNHFSAEEKKAISKGLENIKNGEVVSHEVVMKNTRDRIEAFRSADQLSRL